MLHTDLQNLQAVNRFLKFEISREKELQDIVSLAAKVCETPVALITLLDDDTQYFKFKVGTDIAQTAREDAFCSHVIECNGVLVVPDSLQDERFANNPLVTSDLNIRFYAGAPLKTHDGYSLGSLCVIDTAPKELDEHQIKMLEVLSRQIIHILEFDLTLQILKEQFIEAKNSEIKLRSFFDSSKAIHVLLGRNMELLTFNKLASEFVKDMYGIELKVGIKATENITKTYQADFVANYQKALAGENVKVERLVDYGEKGTRWWNICYNPAFNSEGEIIGVSYTCADVTESKSYEEKMIRQNEMLKRIAYMQSHEFRRPVASILGLMNVIKLEGEASDHKECLEMMEVAVQELDEKVHDIVASIYEPELLAAN